MLETESSKKLIYLLGAGASIQAIPVVSNLPKRMRQFISDLEIFSNGKIPTPEFSKFYKMITDIEDHFSVDTLAKILFTNQHYKKYSYEDLKDLLTCYLMYEQAFKYDKDLIDKIYYRDPNAHNSNTQELKITLLKSVDKRYEALLAALLNSENKINDNIGFISWNYDYQLELALSKFYNLRSLKEVLAYSKIQVNEYHENIHEPSIIHLNGIGFLENTKIKKTDVQTLDPINYGLDTDTLEEICNVLFGKSNNYKSQLKFAWEIDIDRNMTLLKAQKLIEQASHIVVVGYSFPYFNREVDRFIFKNLSASTKLHYLDPKADILKDRLPNINRFLNSKLKQVITYPNIDNEFLIPVGF